MKVHDDGLQGLQVGQALSLDDPKVSRPLGPTEQIDVAIKITSPYHEPRIVCYSTLAGVLTM